MNQDHPETFTGHPFIQREGRVKDLAENTERPIYTFPWLKLESSNCPPPPDVDACISLWNRYNMPAHIRSHCHMVACTATWLARMLKENGSGLCIETTLAAGLLHDLGKAYSLRHGGSHSQLGAAWVMRETKNPAVAQPVYHHVNWLWDVDIYNDAILPALLIVYADKRVKHDRIVSLDERFKDLVQRYGKNSEAIINIEKSRQHGLAIENALVKRLGESVYENTFDCGWLVSGA